jgi:GNAT superfamily N-acetyltransferase
VSDEHAIVLGEATVQDTNVVVHLIEAMLQEMTSHGGHALGDDVRSRLRARFTESLEREDHGYLLTSTTGPAGEPVGVVEASVVSPYQIFRQRPVLHVHSLYVKPRYRGQGIGRGLLGAALAWGRERACERAELNVLAANPARQLYVSLGFRVFELKMQLEL